MSHGEPAKPLPPITSSSGSVDDPLPQMTESTSEAIETQNETFDTPPLPRSSNESRGHFQNLAWDRASPSTRKVFELSQSSSEKISGAEDGLSKKKSRAWQLAYGKSLEPAKEEDGVKGAGREIQDVPG